MNALVEATCLAAIGPTRAAERVDVAAWIAEFGREGGDFIEYPAGEIRYRVPIPGSLRMQEMAEEARGAVGRRVLEHLRGENR